MKDELTANQPPSREDLCRSTTWHLIRADEHRLEAKKAIAESNYLAAATALRKETEALTQAAGTLTLIGDLDRREVDKDLKEGAA